MHLHLLYPEYLEDELDRSIELEWLARPLCIRSKPSPGRVAVYERLRDPPTEWSRQFEALGLNAE